MEVRWRCDGGTPDHTMISIFKLKFKVRLFVFMRNSSVLSSRGGSTRYELGMIVLAAS